MIPNTCPNLSNIVHTDFELGRVMQTVTAADPGITVPATGSLSAAEEEFGNAVPVTVAAHCPPPKLSNAEAAKALSLRPGNSEEWDEEIHNHLRQRDIKEPFEEYKSSFTSFSGVLSPALRQNLEGLFTNLFECRTTPLSTLATTVF